MHQVTALGQALSSPELKGSTFVLAGHTDAKGGDTFNQGLSERRADTVRRFLKEKFNIDDGKLVTVGYGRMQLKNKRTRRQPRTGGYRSSTWRTEAGHAELNRRRRHDDLLWRGQGSVT